MLHLLKKVRGKSFFC